jgi:hypothetical protein
MRSHNNSNEHVDPTFIEANGLLFDRRLRFDGAKA